MSGAIRLRKGLTTMSLLGTISQGLCPTNYDERSLYEQDRIVK